jgi:hypothetical protein
MQCRKKPIMLSVDILNVVILNVVAPPGLSVFSYAIESIY